MTRGGLKTLKKRSCGGQVMVEFALMLVICVIFSVVFMMFYAAFSQYGARLITLVAWEPEPPERSQMERIMNGLL